MTCWYDQQYTYVYAIWSNLNRTNKNYTFSRILIKKKWFNSPGQIWSDDNIYHIYTCMHDAVIQISWHFDSFCNELLACIWIVLLHALLRVILCFQFVAHFHFVWARTYICMHFVILHAHNNCYNNKAYHQQLFHEYQSYIHTYIHAYVHILRHWKFLYVKLGGLTLVVVVVWQAWLL